MTCAMTHGAARVGQKANSGVADRHTCQIFDGLKACNYRSSASPPIHTGLFSLESRL